jgi:thioredoxin 2
MSSRVTGCPSCGTKNRVPAAASGAPRCASCKQPMPWLADATDADLTQVLGTRQLVLMDLWAPWCAPCRMVAPVLERIAERYAGQVKIVKVNVDKNPATAARYDARSIPTLVMLRDGTVVHRTVGAQPEPALAAEVDRLLATS